MRNTHAFGALLFTLVLTCHPSHARSAAQVYRFKQMEPCPATGKSRGPCPGWQVDHITPLCAGGDDKAWNMQWLSVTDHKYKTFLDVRHCRQRQRPRPLLDNPHRHDTKPSNLVVIPQNSVIADELVMLHGHA